MTLLSPTHVDVVEGPPAGFADTMLELHRLIAGTGEGSISVRLRDDELRCALTGFARAQDGTLRGLTATGAEHSVIALDDLEMVFVSLVERSLGRTVRTPIAFASPSDHELIETFLLVPAQ
jgi:hypothetical protein